MLFGEYIEKKIKIIKATNFTIILFNDLLYLNGNV